MEDVYNFCVGEYEVKKVNCINSENLMLRNALSKLYKSVSGKILSDDPEYNNILKTVKDILDEKDI